MPVVLRVGPYRFFWYSADRSEPAHVHVERDEKTAKFWLSPLKLAENNRFALHELRRIEGIIRDHHDELMRKWNAKT
jgi:Domain of unknown function (DUF4160)